MFRSVLPILLQGIVQLRFALGIPPRGGGHRTGHDAVHLGKPGPPDGGTFAERTSVYDRPQQVAGPHHQPEGPFTRPPAVGKEIRRPVRLPGLLPRHGTRTALPRGARPTPRADPAHLRDEPLPGHDPPADRRRDGGVAPDRQLPYRPGAQSPRRRAEGLPAADRAVFRNAREQLKPLPPATDHMQ